MCGEYLCKHSSVMYSTVTGDTNWPAGPGNPARRELGRAFTRRWCPSSWSDHDNNMEQRAAFASKTSIRTSWLNVYLAGAFTGCNRRGGTASSHLSMKQFYTWELFWWCTACLEYLSHNCFRLETRRKSSANMSLLCECGKSETTALLEIGQNMIEHVQRSEQPADGCTKYASFPVLGQFKTQRLVV